MNGYTSILFLFFAANSHAQTIGKCAEVIASTGQSVEKQGIIYSYTVGEPVIFTLSNANFTFSQGFHQPDLCGLVGTNTPEKLANWKIEIFPNPTEETLNLKVSTDKNPRLRADIFDVLGKLVRADVTILPFEVQSISVAEFAEGTYFLRLMDLDAKTYSVSRFVKI
jgi:Secretion system C-terminal sorting domain